MKALKILAAVLGGLFVLVIGIAVLAVVTIDADEQLGKLTEAHATMGEEMLACKDDESCAMAMAEFKIAIQKPAQDLKLATMFGRNKHATEQVEKLITGGKIAACGPAELKSNERMSREMAKLLCEEYSNNVRAAFGIKPREKG